MLAKQHNKLTMSCGVLCFVRRSIFGHHCVIIALAMQFKVSIKAIFALMFASGFSYSTSTLGVELNPVGAAEIEQLLTRLGVSGCRFQRNGSWHSAAEARAHLEKKYRYMLDKQLLSTAENFVSVGATKSSMSGKPYWIQCGTQSPMHSAQWMATQLDEVRESIRRDSSSLRAH